MSQLIHPNIPRLKNPGARRALLLGALMAFAAVGAVVLILAVGGESQHAVPASAVQAQHSVQAQPGVRPDGGPDESAAAAAVGATSPSRPDESAAAAAVGATSPSRPDESAVAAVISGR